MAATAPGRPRGADLGFAGLVAEAFREIAVARADAPDGVEFVVTLQVVADVIVAPAGPGASAESASAGGANADARGSFGSPAFLAGEVPRRARGGFDDAEADESANDDESAHDDAVRGGRGAGAASAAAAFSVKTRRPPPPAGRAREDVDDVPASSAFFVENAVEIVATPSTRAACLARAFRGVARLEAEMASPTTSPTAAYAGERAHVLARFDVLTRRLRTPTVATVFGVRDKRAPTRKRRSRIGSDRENERRSRRRRRERRFTVFRDPRFVDGVRLRGNRRESRPDAFRRT